MVGIHRVARVKGFCPVQRRPVPLQASSASPDRSVPAACPSPPPMS